MPSLLPNPHLCLHLCPLIQWHQYLPFVQGKNSGAILHVFFMSYNIPQCPACNQSLHIDWLHFRLWSLNSSVLFAILLRFCLLLVGSLFLQNDYQYFIIFPSQTTNTYTWSSFSANDFAFYFIAKQKQSSNLLYLLTPHLTTLHQEPPTWSLLESVTLHSSSLHSFLKRRTQSPKYLISFSLSLSLFQHTYKIYVRYFKKSLLSTYLSSYCCFSVPFLKVLSKRNIYLTVCSSTPLFSSSLLFLFTSHHSCT